MIVKTQTEQKTVTTFEIDWAALAAGVERLVLDHMNSQIEHWNDDLSMRQMAVMDANDSFQVCEHLLAGDWNKARKRLFDMDTAARDYVFDFIEVVAGPEFFDCVK